VRLFELPLTVAKFLRAQFAQHFPALDYTNYGKKIKFKKSGIIIL